MSLPPRAAMSLHFGIRITSTDKEKMVREMQAGARHLNAFGILHGGALMQVALVTQTQLVLPTGSGPPE